MNIIELSKIIASCQEFITVGGVYSRETSNDICAWAACTVAVLLLRRVITKWQCVPKEDTVDS